MKREFNKGWNSFLSNNWDNPYKPNTPRSREWQRGWDASYAKNKEKVEERESRKRGE